MSDSLTAWTYSTCLSIQHRGQLVSYLLLPAEDYLNTILSLQAIYSLRVVFYKKKRIAMGVSTFVYLIHSITSFTHGTWGQSGRVTQRTIDKSNAVSSCS